MAVGPTINEVLPTDPELGLVDVRLATQHAWLAIASFYFAVGPVVGLGYTCFAPIAFNITTELGNSELTPWCLNAWTLASCISFLVSGHVSDVCGRRHVLLFGSLLGVVGFIICSTAESIAALISGQTFLGCSTGFLFVTYSAAAEIIPLRWRAVAIGIIDCGYIVPWGSFAVLIANSLLLRSTWRWVFYMGIILETIGGVGIFCMYRPKHDPRGFRSFRQRFEKFDYIGLILFTSGLTAVLIGLMWAGTPTHGWGSLSVLCPIVIGLTDLAGTIIWDAFYAASPIIPYWLIRRFRGFGALTLIIFTTSITFFPMLSYLPQGLAIMFSDSPIEVGVMSLPANLGQGIVLLISMIAMKRIGHLKYQLILWMFLQLIIKAAAIASPYPQRRYLYIFLPAVSLSPYGPQSVLNISLLAMNLPQSILGTAIALNSSMRTAGGALGGAIFNAIFDHVYTKDTRDAVLRALAQAEISQDVQSAVLAACLRTDLGLLLKLIGDQPALMNQLVQIVRDAYGHALQMIFIAAAAICTIPFVLAFVVEDRSQTGLGSDDNMLRCNQAQAAQTT